jgi:hypothetical protein
MYMYHIQRVAEALVEENPGVLEVMEEEMGEVEMEVEMEEVGKEVEKEVVGMLEEEMEEEEMEVDKVGETEGVHKTDLRYHIRHLPLQHTYP